VRVLIHCNGGVQIGVGHVVRSLALAEEALGSGHEVTFVGQYDGRIVHDLLESSGAEVRRATRGAHMSRDLQATIDELAPDVVHLDTYDEVRLVTGAQHRPLLSNVEDTTFGRRPADLLIDPTFGSEREPRDADPPLLLLRGSRFAPLRALVTDRRGEWQLRDEARNVLVVMGGSDPLALTPRVLEVLDRTGLALHVTAIVRSAARAAVEALAPGNLQVDLVEPVADLPALAAHQDLVVSAAGTSVWELCCLGVPMALVCAVDNQRAGYERVVAADAAIGLGETLQGDEANLATRELKEALGSPAHRLVLSRQASRVVDGLGAWRVVRAWEQFVDCPPGPRSDEIDLELRQASLEDAESLLRWRNDTQTRESSRHRGEVTLPGHLAWLEASLRSDTRLLLVATDMGGEVGTVRWDLVEPAVWEVSITVAPDRRGQGMARRLLGAGERYLRDGVDGVVAVEAEVHEGNIPSRWLFARAGYVPDQPADEDGFLRFRKPFDCGPGPRPTS
jgi:spore coat polysaccharide biosynthesis predicted glycosyltransferase SpsG/RimJ/RimL family protein N-acetyltransferase